MKTIEGQSVTTVYAYDPDNRLTTAQANGGVVWQYSFDGNGSLVESRPGDQPGSGAKRYSYNCAGQLTRVESHDGTNYQAQAEMVYNGQGQRLALTAYQAGQSLTTAYLLDGNTLLAATADGATTFYLPGVGEYKEVWSYYLSDGTNSARQMVDGQGTVTLTRSSFTPWGELLALSGMGDFTWGYLGGLLDAATGLIYVGNGQYYDPATGRFLSRCKSEFAQPLRALAGQSAGDDSGAAGAARTHPRQAQGREDRSISGTASCYDGRDNNHYWL